MRNYDPLETCSYRDCELYAMYLADYLHGGIPLYGLRVCEVHANQLIDEHNDDTTTVQLLALSPIDGQHHALIRETDDR